jgi:hypothetical protein
LGQLTFGIGCGELISGRIYKSPQFLTFMPGGTLFQQKIYLLLLLPHLDFAFPSLPFPFPSFLFLPLPTCSISFHLQGPFD